MAADKNKELGPMAFIIGADPVKNIVIFQFNQPVNRLEFDIKTAKNMVVNLQSRIAIAEGLDPAPDKLRDVTPKESKQ